MKRSRIKITLCGDVERAERESCVLGDYSIACKREIDRRAREAPG